MACTKETSLQCMSTGVTSLIHWPVHIHLKHGWQTLPCTHPCPLWQIYNVGWRRIRYRPTRLKGEQWQCYIGINNSQGMKKSFGARKFQVPICREVNLKYGKLLNNFYWLLRPGWWTNAKERVTGLQLRGCKKIFGTWMISKHWSLWYLHIILNMRMPQDHTDYIIQHWFR